MKRLLFFILPILPLLLTAQTNVAVNASIKGLKAGTTVYCRALDESSFDSVKSTAGGFRIKLNIAKGEGNVYLLFFNSNNWEYNSVPVYLDGRILTITGEGPKFKDAKLSGSSAIKDFTDYNYFLKNNPQLKARDELYKRVNELYNKNDSVGFAALEPQLLPSDSIRRVVIHQWVTEHLTSPISAYAIYSELRYKREMPKYEQLMSELSPEAKNNMPGKKIINSFRVEKLTGIGRTALDFTQPDTLGNPVSLTDFRGKYVLIDFWASWCFPCRKENPNVVKAYNTYKEKNFTVLSISFDDEKENWLQAIQKDGLTWNHVSDLKGWSNAVGKKYDIDAIPANILIDPSGKIIAKDLRGDDLENKLAEVLNN